jgi:hypothetical protein
VTSQLRVPAAKSRPLCNTTNNFASTNVNGRIIPNYSPDNYEAYDVAELQIDFTVPEGAEGIGLEYKFGSEEIPDFLNSEFQDFCEILLFLPDGSVNNIGTLPNGKPVTVENASEYSNIPGGSSENPKAPLPDPQDITYNAVTELLTVERSIAGFEGQEARIVIRVADASDGIYDSAIIFDNLRFVGDIEDPTGPVEQALNNHRDEVINTIKRAIRTEAESEAVIYNEFGMEYANTIVNYHGYAAGIIDESELDKEVIELLDETTTQIDGDNTAAREEAYDFYSEMYDAAQNIAADERADLFEQYLLGTHPEQEAELPLGERTPAEAIANYEDEVFPSYKSSFLTELDEGDYSAAEVQAITSFISSRTSYVENALGETDRVADETIDTLLGDGDIKGTSFSAEVEQINEETTDEDTVEAAALISGTIVAVGGLILHKVAAAAAIAKGYVSLKAAASGFKIVKIAKGSKILTTAAGKISSAKSAASYGLHTWGSLSVGSTAPSASLTSVGGLKANLAYVGKEVAAGHILETILPGEAAAVASGPSGVVTWGVDQVVDDIDAELEDETGAMPDACLAYQQRAATITDLSVSNINFTDSLKLDIGNLDFLYKEDGKLFGVETGTLTIRNTGSETFTPNPQVRMQALNTTPAGKDVDVQHPIVFNDPIPQLDPNEEASVTFEYAVPLASKGTSSYEISASLKNGTQEFTQEFDTGYFEFDIGTDFDLFSGVLNPGESAQENHQPETDTKNATYELNYDNNDIDLHITDEQGNHTGMNYEQNTFENQIPGLTHSGNDDGALGNEYATIEDVQSAEYTVEAISPDIGTIIQSSEQLTSVSSSQSSGSIDNNYDISVTEISASELEATVDITVSAVSTYEGTTEELVTTATVDEVKEIDPLNDVSIQVGELTTQSGNNSIATDNITVESNGFDVGAGGSKESSITLSVSGKVGIGTYFGEVQVSANNGGTTDTTQLIVEVFPDGPDVAIGDGQGPPQDLDQDGLYENISGDGEFTLSDIKLLFNNLESKPIQNNPAAFNFSGTDAPEEVTVSDVQALYYELTGK